jgi:predicted nucleic acid-binding protein
VLVRAGASGSSSARDWTARIGKDLRAFAPDLIWIEVANALRGGVRAKLLAPAQADSVLTTLLRLPLEISSLGLLARPALDAALSRGLTAYDACYVVLADSLGATLVTADRGLAAAVERAELI